MNHFIQGFTSRLLRVRSLATGWMVLGCISVSAPASSEIVHGFADFMNGGFDFSEQQTVLDDSADIEIVIIVEPPLGWRLTSFNGSLILMVPDSSLNDLTTAPSDSSLYSYDAGVFGGVTYVVRTVDGLYAKFAILRWRPYAEAYFEYYVQMDGTTNMDTRVPVHPMTWGRIKALFDR